MRRLLAVLAVLSCTACDQLGIASSKSSEAEGNAVGAACRQAGRALEDCYQINPQASKSAVFAGWRSMNDYMIEQKLDVVRPTLPPNLPKALRKRIGLDGAQSGVAAAGEAAPVANTTESAPATEAASSPDEHKKNAN